MNCNKCKRPLATCMDEADHNTGACSCKYARSLCWKEWNNNRCTTVSIYDKDYLFYKLLNC